MSATKQSVNASIRYPSDVGRKFDTAGNALPFPGNTILWHLEQGSDVHIWVSSLMEKLKESLGSKVAWLPEDSLHITLFEGVCDQVRKKGFWPVDLSEADLETCNRLFSERLRGFDLRRKPPYEFQFDGVYGFPNWISLQVQPCCEKADLSGIRNDLASRMEIRHPIHEDYQFHISLGYCIEYLTELEEQQAKEISAQHMETKSTFKLGLPEFCTFRNMHAFDRQFYLGTSIGSV